MTGTSTFGDLATFNNGVNVAEGLTVSSGATSLKATTVDGLLTAQGGVTITEGQKLTMNGKYVTDMSSTVGSGSDTTLATTKAVKDYVDTAADNINEKVQEIDTRLGDYAQSHTDKNIDHTKSAIANIELLDDKIGALAETKGIDTDGKKTGYLEGETVADDLRNLDTALANVDNHVGSYDNATHANIDKTKTLTANVEALGDKVGELDTGLTNLQSQVGSISETERAGTTYLKHETGATDTVSSDLIRLDSAISGVAQGASEELKKAIGTIGSEMDADGKITGDTHYIADKVHTSSGDTARSVADNLKSLDANLARVDEHARATGVALGGSYTTDADGNESWSADIDTSSTVNYDKLVNVSTVTAALESIKGTVGTSAQVDTAKYNGVSSEQSVNSNIAAINSTLGNFSNLNVSRNFTNGEEVADDKSNMPQTVIAALNSIDTVIGDKSKISYEGIDGADHKATYQMDNSLSVSDAVAHVASHIGTANFMVSAEKYDEDGKQVYDDYGNKVYEQREINGVSANNTVNMNIASLNANVGDVEKLRRTLYASNRDESGNPIKTSVTDAISNLDNNMYLLDRRSTILEQNVVSLHDRYKKLRKDFQAGMASMAAMSALAPNARASGDTQLSVGTGAYSGHTAAAVGAYHWLTDNLMLNAGAAWGNSSDTIYRLGVTYSW